MGADDSRFLLQITAQCGQHKEIISSCLELLNRVLNKLREDRKAF